jgi:hypothetical protein
MLAALLLACVPVAQKEAEPLPMPLVVVTFNTGSSGGFDPEHSGDYGREEADATDQWYGNGLAWEPLIQDTAAWVQAVGPDIVAFQEIFWPGDCPNIPAEVYPGFVCEDWQEGDLTVVERVLGPDYNIGCFLEHPDKCVGVHRRLGEIQGCTGPLCLEGLAGAEIPGCGHGGRIGRGVIELEGGGEWTVVGVHGSSGFTEADQDCRVQQFAQIFQDLDGAPAANGASNLILGDFNTDPGRLVDADRSAAVLAAEVDGDPFRFLTEVGPDVEPTYAVANIDHVIADHATGDCYHGGLGGHPEVSEMGIFDHRPAVCTLELPPP